MRYAVEVKGRRLIPIRHPEPRSLALAPAFHSSSARPLLVLT